MHNSIKSIKQETLDEFFFNIFANIDIPKKAIEILKPKIIKALDDIYEEENNSYNYKSKRLKDLSSLMKKANEERLLGKLTLSEDEFNEQMNMWQDEKSILSEEIKNMSNMNKTVYKNIDVLMNFLNNLPDTYANADTFEKQKLLRMVFQDVLYNTETQKLTIKLKPIFQAFKIINDNLNNSNKKVTTLKNLNYTSFLGYMAKNIEISLNNNVTTRETLVNTKKEPCDSLIFKNVADGDSRPKPIFNLVAK